MVKAADFIFDVIAESLSVYWEALRRTWRVVLAVMLPLNAVIVLVFLQTSSRFSDSFGRFSRLVFGIVAFVAVTRAAWRAVAGPTDEARIQGGFASAVGRAFLTEALVLSILCAYTFVSLVGIAYFVPRACALLSVEGAVDAARTVLVFVYAAGIPVLVARWLLAVTLSSLSGTCGFRAMGASVALLKGRMAKGLLFAVWAVLVTSALAFLPRLAAFIGFRHPFTDSTPVTWAWAAVMTLAGTLSDVAVLFIPVAFAVYARRLGEPVSADIRLPRRTAIALSLAGFALALAWEIFSPMF